MNQQGIHHLDPIWQEYLFRLAQDYTATAQEVIGDNLVSVVLFGSVARGEAHANSDIDLLIICDKLPAGAFLRQAILEPVRQQLHPQLEHLWEQGFNIDFTEHLKQKEDAAQTQLLYLDIAEEGVILFDNDDFLANILDTLRTNLHRIGAKQGQLNHIRYWDLMPNFRQGEAVTL